MDLETYQKIEKWFREFTSAYRYDDPEHDASIALKINHTMRVSEHMARLASIINMDTDGTKPDIELARTVGLLHDTGRFPQYHRYRTFLDARSVNHGVLGAEVLRQSHVLGTLTPQERDVVLGATKYHNAFAVPRVQSPGLLLYLRMIRDADKLDVWRVLAQHFRTPAAQRSKTVNGGLTETPGCSDKAISHLASGSIVPLAVVGNLNDLRLMYVSWAYDIYFPATCAMALDAGDLWSIASEINTIPKAAAAVESAMQHLRDRAGQERTS